MKKLLFALVLFFAIERFCYFQTSGFILSKMLRENIHPPSGPSETLTLIGTGKQFYAFETADHQYVVKFMKFSRRRPLPWLEKLPFSWTAKYLAGRAKKLADLESSCALAQNALSAEAALISYSLPQNLVLIDKLGIAHVVDRDQTQFIVQKKAISFTDYLDRNPSEAKTLVSSYIKTIASQCEKGICNFDTMIQRNYGVVDRQVVMDVGSLLANPQLVHKARVQREIFVELLPLRQWLKENHPQHVDDFDHSIQRMISRN